MKRTLFAFTLLASLTALPAHAKAFEFNPNFILSDGDLTDSLALDLGQIQGFLNRGFLGTYVTEDHEGVRRTAAEIIWRAAQNVGISPKFLLVLLQKEQSLVEDDNPNDRQLDWATGYAVCDSCSKDDPSIQRWKGFGKQVNSAALQFVEGYLADIESTGTTQGVYGPGVAVAVDDELVTPTNAATAALYAYTPHLHGNENFGRIWDDWFGLKHPTGTLLKSATSPDVYYIDYGVKRHINSWSALISRFNPNLIIEVSDTILASYSDGRAINFPNYSLFEDENGTRYLLVDDALRAFESDDVFRSIGFVEDELVSITSSDVNLYETGAPITLATTNPQGQLLQLTTTGAVYYIQDGMRHPVIDRAILDARFSGARLIPAEATQIEQYREGTPVSLPDGVLAKSDVDPTVYVISEGFKRAISNESIFRSYGWSFDDVLTVTESTLRLHATGEPITDEL